MIYQQLYTNKTKLCIQIFLIQYEWNSDMQKIIIR